MSSHLFTYAVGDIYGDHAVLTSLLDRIHEHADGEDYRLVFVGNTIDHGPNGAAVLYALRAMELRAPGRVVVLRGWHEQLMAEAGRDEASFAAWMRHGGQATLRSFGATRVSELPREVFDWVARRPPEWHDELRRYVGDPELALAASEPAVTALHLVHGGSAGHDRTDFSRPREKPGVTDIDTGAGLGGYLTAAIFTHQQAEPLGFFQAAEQGPVRFLKPSLKPATVREFRLVLRSADGVPETAAAWAIRQDADTVAAHLAAKQRRSLHRKAWAAAAALIVAVGGSALLMRPAMDFVARSIAPADEPPLVVAGGSAAPAEAKQPERLTAATADLAKALPGSRTAGPVTPAAEGGTTVIVRSETPAPVAAAPGTSVAAAPSLPEPAPVPAPEPVQPVGTAAVQALAGPVRPLAEPGARLHALPLPPDDPLPDPVAPPAVVATAEATTPPAPSDPVAPASVLAEAPTVAAPAPAPTPAEAPAMPVPAPAPAAAEATTASPVVIAEAVTQGTEVQDKPAEPPSPGASLAEAAPVVMPTPPPVVAEVPPAAPAVVSEATPAPAELAPAPLPPLVVAEAAAPADPAATGATTPRDEPASAALPPPEPPAPAPAVADAPASAVPDAAPPAPSALVVAALPAPEAAPSSAPDAPAVGAAAPATVPETAVEPQQPQAAAAATPEPVTTSFALSLEPSQVVGWGRVGLAAVVPGVVPSLVRFASIEVPPLPSSALALPTPAPVFMPAAARPKPKPKPVVRRAPVHGVTSGGTQAPAAARPAVARPVANAAPASAAPGGPGEPIDLRALIDHPIDPPRPKPVRPRPRSSAELPTSVLPLKPPPRTP